MLTTPFSLSLLALQFSPPRTTLATMPTLNNLDCTILLPPTSTPLPEYRRRYLDSSVSAYIPVPVPALPAAQPFAIRLRADNWVAPGLAAFVFIDGIYHANRSKRAPLLGSEGGSAVEILLRQKEEKVAGAEQGMFVGREWRFGGLDVGMSTRQFPHAFCRSTTRTN